MMDYRISVLIGLYNCEKTLEEALNSLLAQTYQNFKVIMCDDGSVDNTYKIAQEYVFKYPDKFVLIRNSLNMGLNYTLNHCLEYADTEFCARMDGDDISVQTRFEKEIKFLDNHPEFSIVSSPMIYFDEKGVFRKSRLSQVKIIENNNFIKGTPFCHAPCMVRTEAYKKVGGYTVNPKLLRVEDYHLWFKMYAAGYKGAVLPEPLYMMRDDRSAVIRRNWRNRLNEYYVRKVGYRMLGIPYLKRLWMFRPILVGLLPRYIYYWLHKRN